jgi:type I restriction enzyme, S subunit
MPAVEGRAVASQLHTLAEGWSWVRLHDVCNAINGRAFKSTEWRKSGIPIIRIQNLNDPDAEFNCFDGELNERHRVRSGDLLFAWSGTPGTSFGAHIWKGPEAALNQHIFKIEFDSGRLDSKYFCLALNQNVSRYVAQAQGGVGLAHITKGKFLASFIPIAPKEKQIALVAEIEKQFSRLDEAVTNLERVKANLKRYKASVLKVAVEGRLVPIEADLARSERRGYESAADMLKGTPAPPRPNRYSTRSRDVIPGHAALSVGHTGARVPEGWSWAALTDVARMESGHTPSRNHNEWWEGDIPWIGIVDARKHHGGVIKDTGRHTNDAGLANSAARLLPAGTVCVSRTASVGYVVVMGRPMATSQDFVNWIPTAAVTSDWLRIVFFADREALIRFGKGSVHKTIYFPEWLAVHVAVPPRAEQRRIAEEVDRRLSIVDAAAVQVAKQLERASTLRAAVLARAFGSDAISRGRTLQDETGVAHMRTKKLPTLPAERNTDADDSRLDLVAVLANYPDGIEPEELFREAGYKGDQIDQFYRDLDVITGEIERVVKGSDLKRWPAASGVRLALRKK